jgi:hypothetical protein
MRGLLVCNPIRVTSPRTSTWPEVHIHRYAPIRRVAGFADAQLAHAVVAPALDAAGGDERARVPPSQGDGSGGDS